MKGRDYARGDRQLARAIRERLSYANVMATAAVFMALGGSAWAVAANSVGPKQIKKNAVRAKHVKKNAVRAKHVKKNQIRTRHIRNGGVTEVKLADGAATGAKIDESTLGTVPSAALALGVADGAVGNAGLADDAKPMWAAVSAAGEIVAQSGGISIQPPAGFVGLRLRFPQPVQGRAIVATPITSALGSPNGSSDVKVAPCGPGPVAADGATFCGGSPGNPNDALAITFNGGAQADVAFYIVVLS